MCRALDELKEPQYNYPNNRIVLNVEVADIHDRNETGAAFIEFCEKNGIVWNNDAQIHDLGGVFGSRITLRSTIKGIRAFFTYGYEATHYFDHENMDLLKLI